MKMCFLIDDNMHWALIDLFLGYSFCIHDYFFIRGCFRVACYCLQKSYAIVPQGRRALIFHWVFFWRLRHWDFSFVFSLFRFLTEFDYGEIALFDMIITWIFSDYSILWNLFRFFRWCFGVACYFFQKELCNYMPQGRRVQPFDWVFVFWRLNYWDFSFADSLFRFI